MLPHNVLIPFPPRRGYIIPLSVDTTARPYALSSFAIGGFTPDASNTRQAVTILGMQAETNDVYFYFSDVTNNTITTTDAVSAGGSLAYDDKYTAIIKKDIAPQYFKLNRAIDKFLVVRATAGAILRFWNAAEVVG